MIPGKKKAEGRILVIDDEKWIGESLELLFSRKGYDVKSVLRGEKALEAIEKKPADLVILDYNLPDINGLEVLEQIRETDKNLPVIFMTGYGSETISIKAFKLGIDDYLIKPFDPKTLMNRVSEIIGEKKKEQLKNFEDLAIPPELGSEIEDTSNIGRTLQFIKENYQSSISLEEVAEKAGISRFHFTRLFKRVMGISFTDYMNYLRTKKAEEILLKGGVNVSEVAFAVGYNSLRQFERAFKSVSGKTALQHRREKLGEKEMKRKKKARNPKKT